MTHTERFIRSIARRSLELREKEPSRRPRYYMADAEAFSPGRAERAAGGSAAPFGDLRDEIGAK